MVPNFVFGDLLQIQYPIHIMNFLIKYIAANLDRITDDSILHTTWNLISETGNLMTNWNDWLGQHDISNKSKCNCKKKRKAKKHTSVQSVQAGAWRMTGHMMFP